MRVERPASAEIARLSPTSFEVLRECRLRVAFGQQPSARAPNGTPATRLGTVCHNVLDEAVRARVLQRDDWRYQVARVWNREIAAEEERAPRDGIDEQPTRWPGYQLKRARLFQVAARVREFLAGLPADAEVLTEVPLTAAGDRLHGRADLIIRSAERHQIIDYKSGGVVERETNRPRHAYVRQLQLYAYLEHEASGSWPMSAHLFPLHGSPVEIDVEPRMCAELAAKALDARSAYNAEVPNTPLATPAPDHCRWCPYATVCASFWAACDESWTPAVVAAAGWVTNVYATPLGGVTVYLDVRAGSVFAQSIVIKNIDPDAYPEARELNVGDEVAAVGLVADERGSGYWFGRTGILALTAARNAFGPRGS